MTASMQQTILQCGFLPPEQKFVKPDPRGKEYGYFQVIMPFKEERTIRVYKRDKTGILEWACTFDDQVSFGNWAKSNT